MFPWWWRSIPSCGIKMPELYWALWLVAQNLGSLWLQTGVGAQTARRTSNRIAANKMPNAHKPKEDRAKSEGRRNSYPMDQIHQGVELQTWPIHSFCRGIPSCCQGGHWLHCMCSLFSSFYLGYLGFSFSAFILVDVVSVVGESSETGVEWLIALHNNIEEFLGTNNQKREVPVVAVIFIDHIVVYLSL